MCDKKKLLFFVNISELWLQNLKKTAFVAFVYSILCHHV